MVIQIREPIALVPSNLQCEVLILGAGFSRAVSEAFPVTDNLGREATRRSMRPTLSRGAGIEFGNGSFEAWLSRIAEPQPYLSDRENVDNASLFVEMRELIHRILSEAEEATYAAPPPDWFYDLLAVVNFRQASLITLNYDTLIEVGTLSAPVWGPGALRHVTDDDILGDLPPLATQAGHLDGLPALTPTFRLFKLHGSLNWYAAHNDSSGATLRRAPIFNRFERVAPYPEDRRIRELPGREPFLVPPSSFKSGFFQNPIMREIWRGAFSAIKRADRVSLLGYSVPTADVTFAGLLDEAIDTVPRCGTDIEIVNPYPEPVHAHLAQIDPDFDARAGDIPSIPEFVEGYVGRACRDFVRALKERGSDPADPSTRIYLPWGPALSGLNGPVASQLPALEIEDRRSTNGSVVVDFRAVSLRPIVEGAGDVALKLAELMALIEGADRILAKVTDEAVVPVIGGWLYGLDNYHTPQLVLAPAWTLSAD